MKKIALFSAIALSALMVGCSSTETRSDEAAMGDMQACKMKQADGKACPMEGKMDAKACAKCKEMKDGKMCADCKAKMHAMACAKCKEMKDGKMCDKCKAKMADMKGMDCKMGDKKAMGDKKCAKCDAKKAAMNDAGSN
jgi:hypothetical protein